MLFTLLHTVDEGTAGEDCKRLSRGEGDRQPGEPTIHRLRVRHARGERRSLAQYILRLSVCHGDLTEHRTGRGEA